MNLQTLEHWYFIASGVGSAFGVFLTAVAVYFPQYPWISKLAALLGKLPVIDVHGLTLGKMEKDKLEARMASLRLPKVPEGLYPPNPATCQSDKETGGGK